MKQARSYVPGSRCRFERGQGCCRQAGQNDVVGTCRRQRMGVSFELEAEGGRRNPREGCRSCRSLGVEPLSPLSRLLRHLSLLRKTRTPTSSSHFGTRNVPSSLLVGPVDESQRPRACSSSLVVGGESGCPHPTVCAAPDGCWRARRWCRCASITR